MRVMVAPFCESRRAVARAREAPIVRGPTSSEKMELGMRRAARVEMARREL
jgi:hypothetical protein